MNSAAKGAETAVKGKVVLVGDHGVGKTAIINQYKGADINAPATIGANSSAITVNHDGRQITLNVWDTAGQEAYKCLVPVYARCAQVGLVVYDQSDPQSFQSVNSFITQLQDGSQVPNIIVVANKCDLAENVKTDEAIALCNQKGVPLVHTSALSGFGIQDLFYQIATVVIDSEKEIKTGGEPLPQAQVDITKATEKKSGCGC